MLDAGNRELWEQGFILKSAKHEREGEHSGEVIFSVVEFTYGVECIELQVENCGLLARYLINIK